MLDILNRPTTELPLDTTTKRERIKAELCAGSDRSDREIARIVGVDHKTVGSWREKLGIASQLGNSPPTPTGYRHMLIEGCKDFDKKFPPGPSEVRTAEEAVDNAIAEGKISAVVQGAVDQVRGMTERIREERQMTASEKDQKNGEETLIVPQREITMQHDDEMGEWIIKQKNWPDDDGVIIINDESIAQFLEALTNRLGTASIRGSDARA
jgi:hypothetical protein